VIRWAKIGGANRRPAFPLNGGHSPPALRHSTRSCNAIPSLHETIGRANHRPTSPVEAGWQVGRGLHAPPSLSSAVAHLGSLAGVLSIMKHTWRLHFVIIAVGTLFLCGCATGSNHGLQVRDRARDPYPAVDSLVNDRQTWVDPAHLF